MNLKICRSLKFLLLPTAFIPFSACDEQPRQTPKSETAPLPSSQATGESHALTPSLKVWRKLDIPPLSSATLAKAAEDKKLVLAIVSSSLWPGLSPFESVLEPDSFTRKQLDSQFVLAAIDADQQTELHPEIHNLCLFNNLPLRFPFLVWLTPAGHPVYWSTLPETDCAGIARKLTSLALPLDETWKKETDFIIRDAKSRHAMRISQFTSFTPPETLPKSDDLARLIPALYDSITRNFDSSEGVLPAEAIAATATIALNPDLPESIRQMSRDANRQILDAVLSSSCSDPLAGAFSLSRLGTHWDIRINCWPADTQAAMAEALTASSLAQDNPEYLALARKSLQWVQSSLALPDASIATGRSSTQSMTDQVAQQAWLYDKLQKILASDEFDALASVCDLSPGGNFPTAPQLSHFAQTGQNLLSRKKTFAQAAKDLSLPAEEISRRYLSALSKIQSARPTANPSSAPLIPVATSATYARQLSAWCKLAKLSRLDSDRQTARKLYEGFTTLFFSPDHALIHSRLDGQPDIQTPRALDLAAAIRALLDYRDLALTPDNQVLDQIHALYKQLDPVRLPNGFYRELPENLQLFALSSIPSLSLISPSCNQMMYENLKRLADILNDEAFRNEALKMEPWFAQSAMENPIPCAFYLQALFQHKSSEKSPIPSAAIQQPTLPQKDNSPGH